jgi:hypothetical protein
MALVKLETEGGNVDALEGVAGRVEAESGGGSMHLDDIGGGLPMRRPAAVRSMWAAVTGDLGPAHRRRLRLKIRQANGKVVAETGGGSIRKFESGAQGATVIETGGGSVEVKQCNGEAEGFDRWRQH